MNKDVEKWSELSAKHQQSLDRYVSLANGLSEPAWVAPIGEGKWTPIEITEHLRSVYQIVLNEMGGGKGLRLRTGLVTRTIARVLYLPKILKNRQMPKGMVAPTEIRPTNCIDDRAKALTALKDFGMRAEAALGEGRKDPNVYLTHHLLGKFKPTKGLEFLTIHLEHHTGQLPIAND